MVNSTLDNRVSRALEVQKLNKIIRIRLLELLAIYSLKALHEFYFAQYSDQDLDDEEEPTEIIWLLVTNHCLSYVLIFVLWAFGWRKVVVILSAFHLLSQEIPGAFLGIMKIMVQTLQWILVTFASTEEHNFEHSQFEFYVNIIITFIGMISLVKYSYQEIWIYERLGLLGPVQGSLSGACWRYAKFKKKLRKLKLAIFPPMSKSYDLEVQKLPKIIKDEWREKVFMITPLCVLCDLYCGFSGQEWSHTWATAKHQPGPLIFDLVCSKLWEACLWKVVVVLRGIQIVFLILSVYERLIEILLVALTAVFNCIVIIFGDSDEEEHVFSVENVALALECSIILILISIVAKRAAREGQTFARLGLLGETIEGWACGKNKRLRKKDLGRPLDAESPGRLEMFWKWLSDIKIDPEAAFLISCESGDKTTMRSLLSEHGDLLNVNLVRNAKGDTGLHLACRTGQLVIAESLLDVKKHMVNVNIENSIGETPLMIAAGAGHRAIVKRLVRAKGIRLKEKHGEQALWKAVQNDHYEVADILLIALAKKRIAIDPNLEPCIKRGVALSREAETTLSETKLKERSQILDVYKKSIKAVICSNERTSAAVPAKTKTTEESIEELEEFLECTICFNEFENMRIFACVNDHWMCARCLPQNESCPFCRVEFNLNPPSRRLMSEKFLRIVMSLGKK